MRTFRAPTRLAAGAVAVGVGLLLQFAAPARATAQTIVQHDFENGTTQGWAPRGSVTLANVTEAAASGTHSLRTSGRTAAWNGPSLDILPLLSPSTVYRFRASGRLVAGEPATQLIMTVQRTPSGGSTTYEQVAATAATGATDAAWVTFEGTYSIAGSNSELLLYVESPSASASFYIDDFSIVVVPALGCSDPQDTSGIHSDFETGTAQGWGSRGGELVAVTSADTHSGTYGLLTTSRTASWQGPSINAAGKMCNGSRYSVSVWAKLAPGQPDTQLRVSIQRTLGGTTNFNTVIGNTTVTANQWVRLRTTYNFAFNYTALSLYVESASGTASFYIDDVNVTYLPPPVAERNIPSVYEALANDFRVGAAVWQGDLTGEHAFLLTKHFNAITSENDMKWQTLQPTEGAFNFAPADAQVAFAKAHDIPVRGHTLAWHSQTPAWVFNDASGNPMTPTPENKALLLQRLETHIRTVLTHFGDDVWAWDVVNEVIDPAQPDGWRRSPWFNITGTEFVDRAFQVAREVAPHARLYLNDYSTTDEPKRTFLRNLLADLQRRGIPVDGIGHQMHSNIEYPSAATIVATVNQFAALGLDQQVTEMDLSIYSGNYPDPFTAYEDIPAERFTWQAFKYRDFFQSFRYLSDKINLVTFWGQADDHTWLTSAGRVNAPLLFDDTLKHKLAYTAVVDPSQLPGAGSTATFSGAFVVRAGADGTRRTAASTFALSNNGPSGTLTFNYNDAGTKVRFKGTAVLTYDLFDTQAGPRVAFTAIGDNTLAPGFILTGYTLDGGPEGSGLDTVSITLRTPTGAVIYQGEGAVSEGDVVITP
jgi:endo-1,4-beta-xylanase